MFILMFMKMKYPIYMDEAGRWPLAWDMYAWVCMVLEKIDLSNYKDSKKCTENRREKLFQEILENENVNNILYGIWVASVKEIDDYWISKALNLAYCRWIFNLLRSYFIKILKKDLSKSNQLQDHIFMAEMNNLFSKTLITYSVLSKILKNYNERWYIWKILIDWNSDYWLQKDLKYSIKAIIDWDDLIPWISMASILAKVSRDSYMKSLPIKYDKYDFSKHKGYWTKDHIQSIINYWVSPLHRKLFLRKMADKIWVLIPYEIYKKQNTTIIMKNNKKIINKRKKMLLHVCCAPDMCVPYEMLVKYFDLYIFWYNPNINNPQEHKKRYKEYNKLCSIYELKWNKIVKKDYYKEEFEKLMYENKQLIWLEKLDHKQFNKTIAQMPEQSNRCFLCFVIRFNEFLSQAKKLKVDYVCTTLSISPKKDYKMILDAKNIVFTHSKKPIFLEYDFKKNEGYKLSIDLTKQYWIRRQNYCWCNYSLRKK